MGFNPYQVTQLSFQCINHLDFPEIIVLDWGANDKTLIEFLFSLFDLFCFVFVIFLLLKS